MKTNIKNLISDFRIFIIICVILGLIIALTGCSTVHKSSTSTQRKVDSVSVTVVDSIHVKKYDTSKVTHEITEYQTKTVEVFDTIRTVKDSFVTVLKTRTIWTNGKQEKTKTQAGVGSDSIDFFKRVEAKLAKSEKTKVDTKDKSGFSGGKIIIIALALLTIVILFLLGIWAIKKFQ